MISICVTIKNRSRVPVNERQLPLFPNCVESMVHALEGLPNDAAELVVTDWHSTDRPLREWLAAAAAPWPARIVPLDGEFNRGLGRNAAAQAARGDELFFLDADCLISREVIQQGRQALQTGQAFFPVLYSYDDPEHATGHWRHEGYGNCLVTRPMLEAAGGWPQHASWGREDTGFHHRIAERFPIVRLEVPGFYHQWHPDELAWKDRYTRRAAHLQTEAAQATETAARLNEIIPIGERYILVDDARLGSVAPKDRHAIPFLERNGEYWGAPPDDQTAVREFERLRRTKTSFIAFAWMTRWWLEFYSGLNQHLRSRFLCILDTQQLVVFDLRQPTGGTS